MDQKLQFTFEPDRTLLHDEEGRLMGRVTHPRIRAGVINIQQVYTEPDFRGQGVAAKLMEGLLDHLRETDQKALLTCSYAQKYVGEHPEQKDLLASVMPCQT